MTTPNELYERTPESFGALHTLIGFYYNHIEEAGVYSQDLYDIASPRVEIKVLKEFYFDYRRFWRLATVWFDGQPVMIVQNAGREGDDHSRRFITDFPGFAAMCMHIRSLIPIPVPQEGESKQDHVAVDSDIPELTFFYSNSLDGYFERY